MSKIIFFFLMIVFMVMFSLILIAVKVFTNIDVTLSQCMMPVWIGIPAISFTRFIFYRLYKE